jgi:adenylate cyclase
MSNLLVMFADISESVRLYESLGDAIAHRKITQCLNTIMTVIQGHNGNVIKTLGDEVMGTFSTVEAGIAAGCEMQSYLEDQRSQQGERSSLAIHVGMHYGPVILEKGDVFGDTVNTAKGVANMAKIGQIITTESVAEKLSPPWRARTRHIDRVLLKGKKKRMDIFEVIWQSRDITFKRIGTGPLTSPNTHLYLHYQDRKLIVDENP